MTAQEKNNAFLCISGTERERIRWTSSPASSCSLIFRYNQSLMCAGPVCMDVVWQNHPLLGPTDNGPWTVVLCEDMWVPTACLVAGWHFVPHSG